MPFNTTAKNQALDSLDETSAAPSSGIGFIGIHQLGDPGIGLTATGTEATGGSPAYARKACVWGAASAGQKTNTGALTFDVPSGTYAYFGLWNALTGNSGTQYLGYIPFGGASAIKGFATVDPTLASSDYFADGHGLANGDRVIVYPEFGGVLTAGLTTGTVYYVVGAATNTFQLSATLGGAALTLTALNSGAFYWQRVVPEVFAAQGQITVAVGALVLDATAM